MHAQQGQAFLNDFWYGDTDTTKWGTETSPPSKSARGGGPQGPSAQELNINIIRRGSGGQASAGLSLTLLPRPFPPTLPSRPPSK